MVEQWTENPCVPGSIPGGTTKTHYLTIVGFLFRRYLYIVLQIILTMAHLKFTILIIALLTTIHTFSQMDVNDDRVYLKDGTVLIGKVNLNTHVSELIVNPEEKPQKIDNSLIEKVVYYINGERNSMIHVSLKNVIFPKWIKLEVTGNVSLYSYAADNVFVDLRNSTNLINEGIEFYLKRHENEEYYFLGTSNIFGPRFRKRTAKYFKDCPVLVEKIKNKEFDIDTLKKVVVFYNNNCN